MAYRIYQNLHCIFELKGPFAKIMTNERKAIVKAALQDGGDWFKAERVPLRFTDWVYRMGYRVTSDWKAFKRRVNKSGRALPYIGTTPVGGGVIESMISGMPPVTNENKMADGWASSQVIITGTAGGGDIIIRPRRYHPIMTPFAEVFHKVAPEEYQLVAQKVAASFQDFLAFAHVKSKRSKKLTIAGANESWVPRGHIGRHEGRGTGTGLTHRKSGV
jgi:hypothetical protein